MRLGLEERFEVKDGFRTITFTGWKLAEADSISPTDPAPARWTELSLFKTTSGFYVLQKVGRSDVFHNEECEPKKGKRWANLEAAVPADEPDDVYLEDLFVPCPQCNPDYDDAPVWVEKDLFATQTNLTAEQVLEALTRPDTRNGKGPGYLSRVARELLDEAREKDDEISRVLTKPVEVQ